MSKKYRKSFLKRNRYKRKTAGPQFRFKGSQSTKMKEEKLSLKTSLRRMGFNLFA